MVSHAQEEKLILPAGIDIMRTMTETKNQHKNENASFWVTALFPAELITFQTTLRSSLFQDQW